MKAMWLVGNVWGGVVDKMSQCLMEIIKIFMICFFCFDEKIYEQMLFFLKDNEYIHGILPTRY